MFKWQSVTNSFPQGSVLWPKAIFPLSSVSHWQWEQVHPQHVHGWHEAVWPLVCLREGMPTTGTWADSESGTMWIPTNPTCSAVSSSGGPSTGNSWPWQSRSRGGPQKPVTGAQAMETGWENNPSREGRRKASGEASLGPSQIQQWGTFMKNRDVLPRPAVAGWRALDLNWYRVVSD